VKEKVRVKGRANVRPSVSVKRGWMPWFLLSACALMLTCTVAAATELSVMGLDEVRVGMKGKARTVFSGSHIEEFDIEILGVLKNWRPKGNLILVRASGQQVEHTGIAAGMSGTPVYIDGKLVGAIAYAWPFSKEPIAGVTPIGEMLEQESAGGTMGSESESKFRWEDSGETGGVLEEIDTPLLLSGFHPAVQRMIESELIRYNMTVAQTGSGNDEVTGLELVAGAPLAAQFVTGDATVSAIGTVTYAGEGRVLGFGHGLFYAGAVEIPMSAAYIHAVLPSLSGSVKLGSASEVVGTITRDGLSGVVGQIGVVPELIPVSVAVESDRVEAKEFNFRVMKHSLLTPSFVGWTVSSAALGVTGSTGDMTIEVDCEIELEGPGHGTRSLSYKDSFFSISPAAAIAQSLAAPLALVMQNQFERTDPVSITCRLSVEHSRKVAGVEEVYLSSQRVAAGDSVEVMVRLRPFRGQSHSERFVLHIPGTCQSERVEIRVCSAPEMRTWEVESTNRRLPPRELEQLISQISSSGRGNRLECVAFVEEREAGIQGKSFPSPPESFSSVVSTSGREGSVARSRIGVLDNAIIDTDYVIQGCRTVSLELDREKIRR